MARRDRREFGETLVNLLETREAPSLVAPAEVAPPTAVSDCSSRSRSTTSTRCPKR